MLLTTEDELLARAEAAEERVRELEAERDLLKEGIADIDGDAARAEARVKALEAALEAKRLFLDAMANRLEDWANESLRCGWSTHQVSANRDAANDCRRMAALNPEPKP